MKNWKYIEGANIGNSGSHLDSAGARQVRELAAKYWHSGIHDTRNLAMTVAWEWAKRSGVARETTQDLVSEIQNVIDRWIKEIKTGNAKIKYTDKRDSKKEYLIDEVSGDLEVWVDGRKVDSLKNAGEGWKKYVETHATKTGKVGNETMREWATSKPKSVGNDDIVKDGNVWVVLYAEGTKSKEFDSEAEAKRFAAQVGNSGIEQEFFKKLADDAKKEEKKDDKEVDKLVGNYQTGTSKFKAGDRVSSYGAKGTVKSIKGENSDNIYGEPLVEVEFDNGKTGNIPEHYLVKIGNSKVGNAGFDLRDPDPTGSLEAKAKAAAQKQQREEAVVPREKPQPGAAARELPRDSPVLAEMRAFVSCMA